MLSPTTTVTLELYREKMQRYGESPESDRDRKGAATEDQKPNKNKFG